ncbi:hypothetical protein WME94_27955 [Sorangium sp. So ce429]
MVMLEAVVLRFLPAETRPSATSCTFPAEDISISFLVIAIAVLAMLRRTRCDLQERRPPPE